MTDNDKSRNKILDRALYYYQELGWSVIPVGKNKVALIDWKKYQIEKPTIDDIYKWFNNPDVNIAVVCGALSGIVAVDIDTIDDNGNFSDAASNLMKKLPTTWHTLTPSGGHHYIYRLGKSLKSYKNDELGIEIKGEGTYIVLPPSISKEGIEYKFQVAPWNQPDGIKDFPYEVFDEIFRLDTSKESNNLKMMGDFPVIHTGQRNKTLTSIVGELLVELPHKSELCRLALHGINKTACKEPLPDKEVNTIFESVLSYHPITKEQTDKAAQLLNFNPVRVSELLKKKFIKQAFLIDRLIPEKGITIISGHPSSYKTWVVLEIAKAVATGSTLFDCFKTQQSGVLFIDEENGDQTLQDRLNLLGINYDVPIYCSPKAGFILNSNSVKQIVDFAKQNNIKLVCFDSLIRIHDGDENNATEMAHVFRQLKELTVYGLTVLCIHHNRKEGVQGTNARQNLRGSSDILASIDCHLAIERKEDSITIKQHKLRQGVEIPGFTLNLISNSSSVAFKYSGEAGKVQSKLQEVKEAIKNVLKNSLSKLNKTQLRKQLEDNGFDFGSTTFKNAVNEMLADKQLYSQKGRGNEVFLSLTPFESTNSEAS